MKSAYFDILCSKIAKYARGKFKITNFEFTSIIIKEQFNCKSTGYWKESSIKYNFLLLAHEYLLVFKK
jgi:hypothetical protein